MKEDIKGKSAVLKERDNLIKNLRSAKEEADIRIKHLEAECVQQKLKTQKKTKDIQEI